MRSQMLASAAIILAVCFAGGCSTRCYSPGGGDAGFRGFWADVNSCEFNTDPCPSCRFAVPRQLNLCADGQCGGDCGGDCGGVSCRRGFAGGFGAGFAGGVRGNCGGDCGGDCDQCRRTPFRWFGKRHAGGTSGRVLQSGRSAGFEGRGYDYGCGPNCDGNCPNCGTQGPVGFAGGQVGFGGQACDGTCGGNCGQCGGGSGSGLGIGDCLFAGWLCKKDSGLGPDFKGVGNCSLCGLAAGLCGCGQGCGIRGCGLGGRLCDRCRHPYGGAIPHTPTFQGHAGPPSPQYANPYYTVRGPRDFLTDNPPSIGR